MSHLHVVPDTVAAGPDPRKVQAWAEHFAAESPTEDEARMLRHTFGELQLRKRARSA